MLTHPKAQTSFFLWWIPLLLSSLASCAVSLPDEDGEANVAFELSDGTTADVAYEPLLGQIQVSPPIEGEVEIVFAYDDPYVEVRVRVDAADVQAGEQISLPVASELPSLQIAVEDGTFTSELDASFGTLTFQELRVETDYARIDVVYDVTLGEVDGERTLNATGRIASTYGSLDVSSDAGVENPEDF